MHPELFDKRGSGMDINTRLDRPGMHHMEGASAVLVAVHTGSYVAGRPERGANGRASGDSLESPFAKRRTEQAMDSS